MLWMGPVSSVFDVATYLLMFFVICPAFCGGSYATLDAAGKLLFISLFQSGWFVESMWSQTLVIHMIRTPKIPFM
jgi:Mg2+-importing ATPase